VPTIADMAKRRAELEAELADLKAAIAARAGEDPDPPAPAKAAPAPKKK
jgi:hypothetical protein